MDVTLLIFYVLLALVVSFVCSICEASLLTVSGGHIRILENQGRKSGKLLRRLTDDIDRPLAAILTLNTIAHTMGAAGAGAQAAVIFGSGAVGLFSAVLTLLILVFTEIIPKTLGAHYSRTLAPLMAYFTNAMIWILTPFVWLSERLTRLITGGPRRSGLSRRELAGLAELAAQEGKLSSREVHIVRNLVELHEVPVRAVMTPRTVVFSLPETMTVEAFFHKHDDTRFSRIPVYGDDPEDVTGFVLRSDLLLAYGRGNGDNPLSVYLRELTAVPEGISALRAFEQSIPKRNHMLLVVDEYGSIEGIVTLEDLLETLLGLEIVDEGDRTVDMQLEARRLARKRLGGSEP